ncbi:MAG TPA: hypothetical protein VGD78_09145 [Chthoniobacterales bacterium]
MVDNPEQVERLLAKLHAALPVPARVTPEVAAMLQAQHAAGQILPVGSVTWISYAGDEGGIVCKVEFSHEVEGAVFASITHLRFDPRLPLAREITAYQKRRVRQLRRQGS